MNSTLTHTLHRILEWIKQYKPWYVEYLQPGLSISEIEEIIEDIPISLPSEVYELYQWRNGATEGDLCRETAWLFANWTFRPLQSAVERWRQFNSRSLSKHWMPNRFQFNSFSLFYNGGDCEEGYIFSNSTLKTCPVIFENFKGGGISVLQKYSSLTSMMLTLAEGYETGAYYHDPAEYKFFISCNPNQVHQIWRKYNSALVELSLQIVQQEPPSSELLMYLSDALIEFRDSRLREAITQIVSRYPHLNDVIPF